MTAADVLRQHAGRFDLVYLHRIENAQAYSGLVRQCFDAQIVYSVADLHHLRLQGESRLAREPERAERLCEAARELAVQEFAAALLADSVITHSAAEAERLRTVLQQVPNAEGDKVHVVPGRCRRRP